ncbi:mechanosensitive ion channel [Halovenus sp. WSH3]|uniref:Mechanosensitive ion channel n=1 Tax=Halovenus carboxidivorans TaxID=2692199 RepID=A0A6B0T9I8_9EURY|nr:mechanosensitive ion channel family protein [Halovenus carboxidivorans]MXR52233.1 mechanosensitive ion channel [Halovenus carboxidivorans]
MQIDWPTLIRSLFSEEAALTAAVVLLLTGVLLSYLTWRWTHTLFRRTGINEAVEGTTFERTVARFGTSTSGIIATLLAIFVYVLTAITAFNVARLLNFELFWAQVTRNLPGLFIAVLAVIVGLIAGDKSEIIIQERLRSVKLPEVSLIGATAKYSIYYIAALIALAQLGVATTALLVLLAAYAFGLVFLSGIAFKQFLTAGAAGVYLLLVEPYTIGDEVRIDDKRGIVQEIDMFVTRIEADGEEYIIPNQQVFRSGIIRIRG